MRFPPEAKLEFVGRLGGDWRELADLLGIPAAEQRQFTAEHPGKEGRGIWNWLEVREELERLPDALAKVRPDLVPLFTDPPPAPEEASVRWEGSPYPGLEWFRPCHAPIFFGRDREVDQLEAALRGEGRLVAVTGASGAGKSSLVAAGLIPRLEQESGPAGFRWIRFTPGGMGGGEEDRGADPFLAFAAALCGELKDRGLDPSEVREQLRSAQPLDGLLRPGKPPATGSAGFLVFIDQFEELFTAVAEVHRTPFVYLLRRLARAPGLRTVLTLRADFYPQCLAIPPLVELLRTCEFPLAPPDAVALMQMITRPAVEAGLCFEPDTLPGRILRDTGAEPGALALMAYALSVLHEDCRASGTRLTEVAYDAFGGVSGAIARKAEEAFAALGIEAQAALGAVFKELVDVDPERGIPTRKRAPRSRFAGSAAALELIDTFAKHRLLVGNEDGGHAAVVDVAHEALLVHWPRLRDWIAARFDDFRQLRQFRLEAAEWARLGGLESHRWPHERLFLMQGVLDRLDPELSELERDFLRPEAERLLAEIDRPETPHARRAWIGERLAVIGDPRPGIGLDENGLPEFCWLPVPPGEITLEGKGSRNQRRFKVAAFEISKYPVTWRQYAAFVEAADGFGNPGWWAGLARREDGPVMRRWDLPNHPAINVCWFDVVAFCRWLSQRSGREVRLPTEWEWQQAATSGNPTFSYPWGTNWDEARANTYLSNVNRTVAVGLYPQGASPVGAFDMSGNVAEWCLNKYGDPGRIEPGGEERRVVRGGAWGSHRDDVSTACRRHVRPAGRGGFLGFRVVTVTPDRK
ncbi:MAG: SUMF1/EgtB/PvdO family nonheme iron enzyme [Verrucomicrobiales bacterium]|nr:SUMF1/EgtB/PvdO family nonheme iron enzyme [Verrucomicrobiales bacterium]